MSTQVALDTNHPMMVAWKQFTATAEYSNAVKWALRDEYDDGRKISAEMRKNHVEGAMWLAFTKPFDAAPTPVETKEPEIALKWLRDNEICGTDIHERLTAELLVRYMNFRNTRATPVELRTKEEM